jgi:MFS family permease
LPPALIGGAVLHRVGLRLLISGGFVLAAVGVAGVVVGMHDGLWWTVAGLVVTGAGLGLPMSVASSAIVGNVPAHRAGMASSVEEVSYELGNLTAVALLGSLSAPRPSPFWGRWVSPRATTGHHRPRSPPDRRRTIRGSGCAADSPSSTHGWVHPNS